MNGAHHAPRVVDAVEEVGISEGDVARPGRDQLGHVADDGIEVDDTDAPVVDDRHGAVAAAVGAAVARLDVSDQSISTVDHQAGVALERGEQVAPGKAEARASEVDERLVATTRASRREAVDPVDESALVLTRQQPVGDRPEGVVAAHRRVEPVEADRDVGPEGARGAGRAQRQPHGRVHGHREREGVGPGHLVRRPRVDAQVERTHVVARPPERGRRRGDVQRLVTQLVRRDQENAHVPPSLSANPLLLVVLNRRHHGCVRQEAISR